LKTLTLDGTQVTDAGMIHLEPLKNLRVLIVPPDRISPAAIQRLREALPNTEINR
jgi:hypothetical protein